MYAIEKTGNRRWLPAAGRVFLCVLGGFARYWFSSPTQLTIGPPNAILPSVIVSRSRPGLRKLSLQRLYRTRTVGAGRWSPDGRRICFAANASGRQNLLIVDSTGGWALQLTVQPSRLRRYDQVALKERIAGLKPTSCSYRGKAAPSESATIRQLTVNLRLGVRLAIRHPKQCTDR